jgi:hypothetical protein
MNQYIYNNDTKEFSYQSYTLEDAPIEEFSTLIEPNFQEGFKPVWNEKDQIWNNVEDHRGQRGWVDGVYTKIENLGPLPNNFSLTPPAQPEPVLSSISGTSENKLN